jgi:hypothetical protein
VSEFWVNFHMGAEASVKQAAAHVYGKKICMAESFTSVAPDWSEEPWALKKFIDPVFLLRHEPRPAVHLPPSAIFERKTRLSNPRLRNSLRPQHYLVGPEPRLFRVRGTQPFMLQQGRFVAEVCYYAGEDAPCYAPVGKKMPAGYVNDSINGEASLTRVSIKDGRLVLPERKTMTPEVLRKIAAWWRLGQQ